MFWQRVKTNHPTQSPQNQSNNQFEASTALDWSNTSNALFELRQMRAQKRYDVLHEDLLCIGRRLVEKGGRFSERLQALELCRADLMKVVEEVENRHFLEGPLEILTKSRFCGCGALSHMAVLNGLMCVSMSSIKHPLLTRALELVQDEVGYKAFCKNADPIATSLRSHEFIQCVELLDDKSSMGKKERRKVYEDLLRKVLVEIGQKPRSLLVRTKCLKLEDDNTIFINEIFKAFTTQNLKCDEDGKDDYYRRAEAIDNFKGVLSRIRDLG